MNRTLTFVPGTMCDRRVWEPVWRALGTDFSVRYIPIELGRSRDDLRRLFETSAIDAGEPMNLVAFSLGGYLALEFSLDRPHQVRSLAIICSSAFGLHADEKQQRLSALKYLAENEYRGVPNKRLDQMLHPSRHTDDAIKNVMLAMDHDLGRDVLVAQLKETSERVDLSPRLQTLSCPVLLIAADADPFCTIEQLETMRAAIPNARAAIAYETGHMVPLERPEWLSDQLRAFHSAKAS